MAGRVTENLIVAVTGASGAIYAKRLLQILSRTPLQLDIIISRSGTIVMEKELGIHVDLASPDLKPLIGNSVCEYWHFEDISAPPASGTHPADAMVVIPCSMGTLAAIANGIANNLIVRAADVCMKEHRPLILVPRETPLSIIHLENMVKAARAGATIVPAMPAFYHLPDSVGDLVDFVVARVLNLLGVEHDLQVQM
jgi:4-hydroxy-3-polyprenylbenzoate decarboxylase